MRGMLAARGKTRSPYQGPSGRGALALLLVVGLLACHGAFGAASYQPTPSAYAGFATMGAHPLAEGYPNQADHAEHAEHASTAHDGAPRLLATFLSPLEVLGHWGSGATASAVGHAGALLFVFSTLFLPWLRGATRRCETPPPRLLFSNLHLPREARLALRPSAPALQVFRL